METETYSPELEAAPLGLNGHSEPEAVAEFEGIWCADLTPERIPFRSQGLDGWVEVRPMPEKAYNEYIKLQTGGGQLSMSLKSQDQTVTLNLDQHKLQSHLVSHSLVGAYLPHRRPAINSPGDYSQGETRLPEGERQRIEFIQTNFPASNPRFWGWLVAQCLRANGFSEGAQGNSPASSGS